MSQISLIVPATRDDPFRKGELATYQRLLMEQEGVDEVEVVFADRAAVDRLSLAVHPMVQVVDDAANHVSLLRHGLAAARGEVLIVLDPAREYAPEAILQVYEALRDGDADVVVGVPRSGRKLWSLGGVRGRTLAILGRLALGTSDGLSGLAALRRSAVRSLVTEKRFAPGSHILLDVLTWCSGTLLDVPVHTGAEDRRRIDAVGLDDLRQLKRVLDHRFGTLSRLVQFCVVGASGMVVDLSLYGVLLWLFASAGFGSASEASAGAHGAMFVAGCISIWAAMSWNFLLNRRLTFNDTREGSIVRQYLTYAVGNALGILVSLTLRLYLPSRFGVFARHRLAAAVVGIVVATGISFSMSRWVVFRRKPAAEPSEQETALV
ncbi:GtrA family protein [Paludisphaera sp.]|uniref:GtrA family protein n=1 Tax=Paludisphaera sp. TaxID=2017432 RepID=UPI00301C1323